MNTPEEQVNGIHADAIIHDEVLEQVLEENKELPLIDEREAEHLRSVMYNAMCKNAGVSIETFRTDDVYVDQFRIVLDPEKCQNPRRNGSAFCQDCSDKHNNR